MKWGDPKARAMSKDRAEELEAALADPMATAAPAERRALEGPPPMQFRTRATIQAGLVIDCAIRFNESGLGAGRLVVSASRHAVIVHQATLRTEEDQQRLVETVEILVCARRLLARGWQPEPISGYLDELADQVSDAAADDATRELIEAMRRRREG